jgi:hypothetical protein
MKVLFMSGIPYLTLKPDLVGPEIGFLETTDFISAPPNPP